MLDDEISMMLDHVRVELVHAYMKDTGEEFDMSVGLVPDMDFYSRSGNIRVRVAWENLPVSEAGSVSLECWDEEAEEATGIMTTKANIWVHLVVEADGVKAIEYDVDELRKLMGGYPNSISSDGSIQFKKIPMSVFKAHAKRIFDFDSKTFLQLFGLLIHNRILLLAEEKGDCDE